MKRKLPLQVRIEAALEKAIRQSAKINNRSLTKEINHALRRLYFSSEN